ncbi:MAG TPA: hypothetical protein VJB65_03215, partial [Patescibacteria group bacterium]|nr:hypothetical protein [Patescibacteria group bacterium]
ARAEGYDAAMIMAPTELQNQNIPKLLNECATKPVAGLSEEEQYRTPCIYEPDVTLQAKTQNRPKNKTYFILYKTGGVEPETMGKTFPECEAIFQAKNNAYQAQGKQMRITGWTTPEHLLAQRKECENNKNHQWDSLNTENKSNCSWLLDSKTTSGYVCAIWDRTFHKVNVHWYDASASLGGLGARSAVIIELEI